MSPPWSILTFLVVTSKAWGGDEVCWYIYKSEMPNCCPFSALLCICMVFCLFVSIWDKQGVARGRGRRERRREKRTPNNQHANWFFSLYVTVSVRVRNHPSARTIRQMPPRGVGIYTPVLQLQYRQGNLKIDDTIQMGCIILRHSIRHTCRKTAPREGTHVISLRGISHWRGTRKRELTSIASYHR